MNAPVYLQRDQPPGVPPLALTGERTLPDVPEENYWFQRHLVIYEWIAARARGRRGGDLGRRGAACSIWPAGRATARRCWRAPRRRSSASTPTRTRARTRRPSTRPTACA